MSSILKALKKLEDEKSARRPDSLRIDAEILRGESLRSTSSMSVLLVAAFLFVCGAGATYVYMKRETGKISVRETPVAAVLPSERPLPAAPAPAAAKIVAHLQKNDDRAQVPQPVKITAPKSEAKHAIPSPLHAAPSKPIIKHQSVRAVKPSVTIRPAVAPTMPSAEDVSRPAAPMLKVNGIAYQDGGADSVAVVNGISVSSGSVIEGAKVEDIQMDRVRFSCGGEKFEVLLGKSNR